MLSLFENEQQKLIIEGNSSRKRGSSCKVGIEEIKKYNRKEFGYDLNVITKPLKKTRDLILTSVSTLYLQCY